MAAPLLALLSQVPWGQVIDAAPKVAEAAGRLWKAVGRRKKDDALGGSTATPAAALGPDATPLDQAQARIQALEHTVAGLRDEMQAATELIKELAEQNAQLVARIELHRRRLARLTTAVVAGTVALGGWALWTWLRT